MDLEEKTLEENYLYKGKILNLKKDTVILPDGKKSVREVVEHSGGCAVMCVKDGKVFMVSQFRYPYKEVVLELPAGKINQGESPEETAKRELEEESGITAGRMEKLFEIYPSPGYTAEKIYIYRAYDLIEGPVHTDEGEFLNGGWFDLEEVRTKIRSGEIKDAKTLVAILDYFANCGKAE